MSVVDARFVQDCYANKVFDYMAAGRPTILAIDGVIREVVEAAHGGVFVKPGDDAALAQKAAELADARELGTELGTDARTYVVTHFDRATQADRFAHLLHNVGER